MNVFLRYILLASGLIALSAELAAQAENYARATAQLVVARQELAVALRTVEAIDERIEELNQSVDPNPEVIRQLADYRESAIELADETARHIDILEQELARQRPQSRGITTTNDPYAAFSDALLAIFSEGIDIADLSSQEDFAAEQPQTNEVSAEDAFWAEAGKFMELVDETRKQRAASQRVTRDTEAQQAILERMYDIREQADDQRETLYMGMVAQYQAISGQLGINAPPPPPPPRSTPSASGSPSGGTYIPPAAGQTEEQAAEAMADNLRKIAAEEEDPEIRDALLKEADEISQAR